jgi:uncharacterized protein YecT (DUF1311 family)
VRTLNATYGKKTPKKKPNPRKEALLKKAIGAKHRSKFAALSPVMVTTDSQTSIS